MLEKWNWIGFVYSIAKGDATKFEEVTKMNLLFCLTFKSFEKDNPTIERYYNERTR